MDRLDAGVGPRRLRIGNTFDNISDELVSKILTKVGWEVLKPRIDLYALDRSREGEHWESVLLKLSRIASAVRYEAKP